jgi:deoxyribodipyrimidine photo-lyase
MLTPDDLRVDAVVAPERCQVVRSGPLGPGPVLLWMQRAQRTLDNAALEGALALGARWDRPVRVLCVVDPGESGLSERTALFMLQGLRDVRARLRERGVGFACVVGETAAVVAAEAHGAAALVTERAYLRFERAWRTEVAQRTDVAMIEVEGDVVVPVDVAAPKAVSAARSLRPALTRLADGFLAPCPVVAVARPWPGAGLDARASRAGDDVTAALDAPREILGRLGLGGAGPVDAWYEGGEAAAERRLAHFVEGRLEHYAADRRRFHVDSVSRLGMHLRFGQIGVARVLRAARAAARRVPAEALASFWEELLVRRELAVNFVAFTPGYDRYETAVPAWARTTLAEHAADPRPHRYDRAGLAAGETHDPYWNAAMEEMRETGYLHNHMRMYWGKKILEWSASPEEAYAAARDLNDAYLLDGRDPNSYAGVGWVFGLHDRPWFAREIFGTVRYMNANGLRRKSDPEAYVAMVRSRVDARGAA